MKSEMESLTASYTFMLIGKTAEAGWASVLERALSPLGNLHVVSEEETASPLLRQYHYDVIIIDAGTVSDAVLLVSHMRAQQPEARIIIATASPTWRRAREALRVGAVDYIRKSLDEKELHSTIQAVLKLPPLSYSRKEMSA
jgi:DNA-binding NtrC family response regulator